MKKLLTFLLAAIAFVACTQNEVEELTANRADIPETLTVGFEGGDTRVELNEALKTVWTEGDEVSVFYRSYENMRWAFQGETGDRSGELKRVSGEVGEQLMDNTIVVYPYNEDYKINLSEGGVEASLPAVQSYKDGSYGKEGNIMVAAGEFTQFTLKSVCGWLRVELTGEGEVVESITVRGNGDEQLAGLCYIDAEDASVTLASDESYAEEDGEVSGNLNFDGSMPTEVVLNCGDGVELGAEATEFYVALLPQTFDKGMTVEINYANGNSQPLVCENSITISRNHISPIGIEANEETDVPTNQLWYTATAKVKPYDASAFNVAIASNEWNEATGEGVITFDGELTTIGDGAFYYCNSLTSVTIPDSVTAIGYAAFCYCGSLTSVIIPDSVTTIGEYAFRDCSSLTSVTIGDSVTTIGDSAFFYCTSLTRVTIPDSVTTIGDSAFRYCSSLTSVTIPDSVTTIGSGAFGGCINLAEFKGKFAEDGGRCLIIDGVLNAFALGCGVTEYTIPDSVTTIGINAFDNCYLTSVTIGDSVTTIGDFAFNYCSSLTSVTIGDSVTTIGDGAFWGCESLTSVTIPDSVTTIGGGAFRYCSNLAEFKGKFAADGGRCLIIDGVLNAFALGCGVTEYTILDSVTAIGNYAFGGCSSLTSVTIPDSVTTIGDFAFNGCGSLTTVTIPDSVTTIGNSAFYGCNSLTSVTIPDSVTTIGDYAFSYCDNLTSVTIGDSVTTIGYGAFWNCSSLTSVYCKATTPPTLGGSYVFDYNKSGRKIYVPTESVGAYKAATNWSEYAADIVGYDFDAGEGDVVKSEVFYTATALVEPYDATAFNVAIVSNEWDETTGEGVITFNGELTTIGYEAFAYCDSLTSVTIPDSVTTIGDIAFYHCTSLTSVTIPESVTTIGEAAFRSCDSLTSVTIPDSVTTIGAIAFYHCTSLTSVTIGDSVTTIGEGAFYHCDSLTSVTIPDSVTTIGVAAFSDCNNLTSVTIGDSVTTIGEGVFDGCVSLTSVTIPDSVTTIGGAAFEGCVSLTSVTIPESVTTIGDIAFAHCVSLTSVTIGDSVTTIGNMAFEDCDSLTSVTIPESVTTIGEGIFLDCESLTSVYCKAITPPMLGGSSVFYGNKSGRKIYVPAESVEAYKAAENWSEYADDIVGYDFE